MARVSHCFSLESCLAAVAAIEADLTHLTATLTEAEFHAPTPTGGWSVAYCIEHLVLTGKSFLPIWDAALKQAIDNKCYSKGPFPYSWWRRGMLRMAEPPYRLKTNASSSFMPCSRRPAEEAIRRFFSMHKEFERQVSMSRGIDVARIRVQSPFVSWIQYPLGFSFDFALAHERRHLWQAWQVRRQLPSAVARPRRDQSARPGSVPIPE